MVIKTEEFQKVCSVILQAVDSNVLSKITETLELVTKDGFLNLNVTNKEYYVNVKLKVDSDVQFHATVQANLFLKLVSATTVPTIELFVDGNALRLRGNGSYSLPLIYEGTDIIVLPDITMSNVQYQFDVNSSVLKSISTFNAKQIAEVGSHNRPVQHMYYVDNEGCITFATSGCVNAFTLPEPIKILLNDKLVKLFKLFKDDVVHFSYGYDAISESIIQTKAEFVTDTIRISAIIASNSALINEVPVANIRGMANAEYENNIVVNKNDFISSLNRLSLFFNRDDLKTFATLEFTDNKLNVCYGYAETYTRDNMESIPFVNDSPATNTSMVVDIVLLRTILDGCSEEFLNLSFNTKARCIIVRRGNVCNIIPTCA